MIFRYISCVVLLLVLSSSSLRAEDWPMWGRDASRNMATQEKGASSDFQIVKSSRNIAWSARMGSLTSSGPVVSNGLVWVGSNNDPPRDPKFTKDASVLLCFRERDGQFLWQYVSPRLGNQGAWSEDFSHAALGSTPLIEGDRLWFVSNRSEVICLDIAPLKSGIGEPKVVWKVDLRKQYGVFPHLPRMAFGFAASVASYKDDLFVVTHNGVDDSHVNVPSPMAPSLVCLNKFKGKEVWTDNSPGKNILAHQLSSPLVAIMDGKAQVIVGQGDGWLRAFQAEDGKLVWKCDLNTKDAKWMVGGRGSRNYVVGTPVLYENRVYIATDINPRPAMDPVVFIALTQRSKATSAESLWPATAIPSRTRTPQSFGTRSVRDPADCRSIWKDGITCLAGPFAPARCRTGWSMRPIFTASCSVSTRGAANCIGPKISRQMCKSHRCGPTEKSSLATKTATCTSSLMARRRSCSAPSKPVTA